jgi:hypothetical protein
MPTVARNFLGIFGAPLFPLGVCLVARCGECGPVILRTNKEASRFAFGSVQIDADGQAFGAPVFYRWWPMAASSFLGAGSGALVAHFLQPPLRTASAALFGAVIGAKQIGWRLEGIVHNDSWFLLSRVAGAVVGGSGAFALSVALGYVLESHASAVSWLAILGAGVASALYFNYRFINDGRAGTAQF